MSKYKVIISRNEPVDVIDVALGVPAKVDTGAFRSSIHATDFKVRNQDGQKVLTCNLLGHPASPVKRAFQTADFSQVNVTNSFGQEENRYEVTLRVKVGPKIFNTSFTLADRSNNLFPVLIGRKLLSGRFLVDVASSNLDRQAIKKRFGIKLPSDEEDLE